MDTFRMKILQPNLATENNHQHFYYFGGRNNDRIGGHHLPSVLRWTKGLLKVCVVDTI